jgi:holdfast attachment protein HfaA
MGRGSEALGWHGRCSLRRDTPGRQAMSLRTKFLFLAAASMTGAAFAGTYNSASSYNNAYGMTAGQENQAANPSLRDANGNLTVVNGQITSASFGQSGVQSATTISSSSLASSSSSTGVGSTYGTATAIGNSLNVVTVGNNNTVIVNSTQTNNGSQTATVSINGSSN